MCPDLQTLVLVAAGTVTEASLAAKLREAVEKADVEAALEHAATAGRSLATIEVHVVSCVNLSIAHVSSDALEAYLIRVSVVCICTQLLLLFLSCSRCTFECMSQPMMTCVCSIRCSSFHCRPHCCSKMQY